MPGFEDQPGWSQIRYRVKDPGLFSECRTVKITDGVSQIYCKRKGSDRWETQALRFDKPQFTLEKARKWVDEHPEFKAEGDAEFSALYTKPLLWTGNFPHPQHPEETIEITEEFLRRLVDETKRFIRDGGRVPVMLSHPKDAKALEAPESYEYNRGWLPDLRTEDGRIVGIFEITNDETAQLIDEGSLVDVSPGIVSKFRNAKGEYGPIINHVALTLKPHLPGQSPFVRLEGAEGDYYVFSTRADGTECVLVHFEAGESQTGLKEKLRAAFEALKEFFSLEGIEYIPVAKPKEDELAKTEDGQRYSKACFLIIGDPEKPSTWKVRVAEYVGGECRITRAQLGRAAAALGPSGFRGKPLVDVTQAQKAAAKKKLVSLYKRLGAEPPKTLLEGMEADEMAELEQLKQQLADLEAKYADLEKQNKELSDAKQKLEEEKTALLEAQRNARKAQFEAKVDALVKEGKLPPAHKPMVMAQFEAMLDKGAIEFEAEADGKKVKVTKPVEELILGPYTGGGSFFERTITEDPTKQGLNFEALDVNDSDALHRFVKAYMEVHKIESYEEAFKKVLERKRELEMEGH